MPTGRDDQSRAMVAALEVLHNCPMLVVMKRVDPEENMNRWYLVTVQATLFAPVAVITAWGSNQTTYQQMRAAPSGTVAEAESMAEEIIRAKLKRGYVMVMDDRSVK